MKNILLLVLVLLFMPLHVFSSPSEEEVNQMKRMIYSARAVSVELLKRSSLSVLSNQNKSIMLEILSNRPILVDAHYGIRIRVKSTRPNWMYGYYEDMPVNATYLKAKKSIAFAVTDLILGNAIFTDIVQLYLHEAGFSVGLSLCSMAPDKFVDGMDDISALILKEDYLREEPILGNKYRSNISSGFRYRDIKDSWDELRSLNSKTNRDIVNFLPVDTGEEGVDVGNAGDGMTLRIQTARQLAIAAIENAEDSDLELKDKLRMIKVITRGIYWYRVKDYANIQETRIVNGVEVDMSSYSFVTSNDDEGGSIIIVTRTLNEEQLSIEHIAHLILNSARLTLKRGSYKISINEEIKTDWSKKLLF